MADLGTIGQLGCLTKGTAVSFPLNFRCVVAGGNYMVVGGKDTTEGNAQPSLRLDAKGVWRFRWNVASGTRTVQVDCKQALNLSPYPSLVVKANPSIGVNSDETGTAAAGSGWKTIGPVTINPSSAGSVWVELRANYDGQYGTAPCYFDNVSTT